MTKEKPDKKQPEAPVKPETVTIPGEEYRRLTEKAAKAGEYWDKLLRMQADFDNTRKRMEKERQEFLKFANEGVILDLLNVLDDLERTVSLAQEKHQDLSAFLKGVEMILAHLYETLKKYGVTAIESRGKKFDPAYHEALMQVEKEGLPEHTIVEEMQKGYLLHERVVRTAKVSVSKTKPR
ncbi:MAG: nucleotide exchange factor GrpE [Candidatus Omnitrophica bacterium]|nr:nucleotide exchange factor GrpE [Candidatus Omnitrophota bacterium]